MNAVLQISLPVFGLGLIGYLATKLGIFKPAHADGLTNFVYNFAVPLLLFRTLANAGPLVAAGQSGKLILAYYLPMAAFYFGGMLLAKWQGNAFKSQVITGFAFSYGNAILLGLPLALLTFGEAGAIPFFILLALHSLTAFTVTTVALEYDRGGGVSLVARLIGMIKGIATNGIIIGIVAGLLFNQLNLTIPTPLDILAGFMQDAVTPCALFALGSTLTNYGIAGRLKQTGIIIVAKCIAFPAAVFACAHFVFALPPLWTMVATLLAAQPVGVNIFIFSSKYNAAQAMATTAVFLSTAFSLLSIPLLLYYIEFYGLR